MEKKNKTGSYRYSVNSDVYGFLLKHIGLLITLSVSVYVFLFTHTALDIFEFGKDVKTEAISLASCPISSIHKVAKSQHQT